MKNIFLLVASILTLSAHAQKQELTWDLHDSWEKVKGRQMSTDGQWMAYQVDPLIGDGTLHLHNYNKSTHLEFDRGYRLQFDENNGFAVFQIKPFHDSLRQAELDDVKKKDQPKDSLAIYLLDSDTTLFFDQVKSYEIGRRGRQLLAITFHEDPRPKPVEDSKKKKKKKKKDEEEPNPKFDKKTNTVLLMDPRTGEKRWVEGVSESSMSFYGNRWSCVQAYESDSVVVKTFDSSLDSETVYYGKGEVHGLNHSTKGDAVVFIFGEGKDPLVHNLFHWAGAGSVRMIVEDIDPKMPEGWSVSKNYTPQFSREDNFIYLGLAPTPEKEAKDSLTKDEQYHVDVWSYTDDRIQPQQLKALNSDRKKSYLAVFQVAGQRLTPLADTNMEQLSLLKKGDSPIALGYDFSPYQRAYSWESPWASDYYAVDISSGRRQRILTNMPFRPSMHPDGSHIVYYRPEEGWYSKAIGSNDSVLLTGSLRDKGILFADPDGERPMPDDPYGVAGFSADGLYVLIYSRYDIWQLQLSGLEEPVSLTNNLAQETKTKYRYVRLDEDEEYIDLTRPMILKAWNVESNATGYWSRQPNAERFYAMVEGDFLLSSIQKARHAEVYSWMQETFSIPENIIMTTTKNARSAEDAFTSFEQFSHSNSFQENYYWGNCFQHRWVDADGKEQKGLLYVPENYKPGDKAPAIIYYYEKDFARQHYYRGFRPSASVINIPYYLSQGYFVFDPDIHYEDGHPGQSALKTVLSAADELVKMGNVDPDRIGLQGQSWGGYQTAYIITQTKRFAAAMAGAPVSNMTSAYGGIRWGSGISRAMQYEHGQSRIGGTLWDDLDLYIENSPIFHLPNVETPLLIMHNDNDGAVPWYQGIEMFMGMRRLDKPCWMLTYNNEEHNLMRTANRKDLSKRMFQFFDHYLDNGEMPEWMSDGLPAIKKSFAK